MTHQNRERQSRKCINPTSGTQKATRFTRPIRSLVWSGHFCPLPLTLILIFDFDLDLDFGLDFGLDFDFDPLESCTDPCSPVEERRFSAA